MEDANPGAVPAHRPHAALYLALAAAWTATAGSLYMSQVIGWLPCEWCWYQRIAMYPLAVLLTMGVARRDRAIAKYALALAIPGALASSWHIAIQKVPAITAMERCMTGVPCSGDSLWQLGIFPQWMTVPMLALTAFLIVIACSALALRSRPALESEGNLPPAFLAGAITVAIVALFGVSGAINLASKPATNPLATGAAVLPGDRGAQAFEKACQGCHAAQSGGHVLIDSNKLKQKSELDVMNIIKNGRDKNSPDNFSGQAMPARGGQLALSDEQILSLAQYLRR